MVCRRADHCAQARGRIDLTVQVEVFGQNTGPLAPTDATTGTGYVQDSASNTKHNHALSPKHHIPLFSRSCRLRSGPLRVAIRTLDAMSVNPGSRVVVYRYGAVGLCTVSSGPDRLGHSRHREPDFTQGN